MERIDADLRHLIATHRPAPLPAGILTALNDIQTRFAGAYGSAAQSGNASIAST